MYKSTVSSNCEVNAIALPCLHVCVGPSSESDENKKESGEVQLPRLSEQIDLEELWYMLGECLTELDKTPDQHAVLILQPAVEAFFLVHAG